MLTRWQLRVGRIVQRQHRSLFNSVSCLLQKGQCDMNECNDQLPTRKEQLKSLKGESFDVLVIGGGAIGCGCALEAATRGLKTALIDAEDFANGASCKSSKLIEGSNSYLNAAIQGTDLQQIYMLQQVLNERATMLAIAPHLNRVQPMMMPIYSPLRLPLYWLGLKLYDAMAGMANVRGSHFMSKEATLNEFPLLRREGLLGSLVYYDGQLDDARMCMALALTAATHGATIANYVRLVGLEEPQSHCHCRKAKVIDELSGAAFPISSRCIINATGAGTDAVRRLDNRRASAIAVPKMGTHIALPSYFGSSNFGLLFPSSSANDRALIMLPFENRLLVGSMNADRCKPLDKPPSPCPDEVDCLLEQTRNVLDKRVLLNPHHVLSAWTGEQPSIVYSSGKDKNGDKVEDVPNFLVEVSDNQMITLAGGRWSTYRVMAVEAIDTAIEHCDLEATSELSCTQNLMLDGAIDYYCMLPLDLVQVFDLPMDVAQHLAESYGSNAYHVLQRTSPCERQRLHPKFPYIDAEVVYACRREYACQLVDVIARRLRVAFVDAAASLELLPVVLNIMSEQQGWSAEEEVRQLTLAHQFLVEQMGLGSIVQQKPKLNCKDKSSIKKPEPNLPRNTPRNSVLYSHSDSVKDITKNFCPTPKERRPWPAPTQPLPGAPAKPHSIRVTRYRNRTSLLGDRGIATRFRGTADAASVDVGSSDSETASAAVGDGLAAALRRGARRRGLAVRTTKTAHIGPRISAVSENIDELEDYLDTSSDRDEHLNSNKRRADTEPEAGGILKSGSTAKLLACGNVTSFSQTEPLAGRGLDVAATPPADPVSAQAIKDPQTKTIQLPSRMSDYVKTGGYPEGSTIGIASAFNGAETAASQGRMNAMPISRAVSLPRRHSSDSHLKEPNTKS